MQTARNRPEGFFVWKMKLGITAAAIAMAASAACAQQTGVAPAGAQPPGSEMRKAIVWKRFEYVCEGHAKVTVYLRDETAKVRYADKQYLMKQTVSADGNRYSDGKVVWWGKGEGGFLQQDTPDGNGEMIVKDCKLVEQSSTEPSRPGVVSGTLTYRERVALPGDAVVEIQLAELPAGDARERTSVIAEQKISMQGKQVPVPFELKFDPAKINSARVYGLNARIRVGGEVRFYSDPGLLVLTQGHPAHVEFVLRKMEAKK
jgi:putative lipoprotein